MKKLIAEARGYRGQDEYGLVDLAHRLADALEALDSAPSVARPLPDRKALAKVIDREHMRLHGSSSGDFGVYLRIADAVLVAIEKGGE